MARTIKETQSVSKGLFKSLWTVSHSMGSLFRENRFRDSVDHYGAKKIDFQNSIKHKTHSYQQFQHSINQPELGAVDRMLSVATSRIKVTGLNHFNITASPTLIEEIKQFYIDVIGLSVGPRAHLDHEGYWLYAGEVPILHLSARRAFKGVKSSQRGHFNHISLSCVGLSQAMARLAVTDTPYRISYLPDIRQTQLFLTDPAGIGVELTFFNECSTQE